MADGILAGLIAQRARGGGEEIMFGLLDRGEIVEPGHAGEHVLDEIGDVVLVADAALEEAAKGGGVAARDGVQAGAGLGGAIGVVRWIGGHARRPLAREGGLVGSGESRGWDSGFV